jgi:hypothetical protein
MPGVVDQPSNASSTPVIVSIIETIAPHIP